jgi:hypothetical protein
MYAAQLFVRLSAVIVILVIELNNLRCDIIIRQYFKFLLFIIWVRIYSLLKMKHALLDKKFRFYQKFTFLASVFILILRLVVNIKIIKTWECFDFVLFYIFSWLVLS